MEKKVMALVAVCGVLLITTSVFAYAYLTVLQREPTIVNRSFVFDWPRDTQTIINATLRINATFTMHGDNLNVITIANYSLQTPGPFAVNAFDTDGDGIITSQDENYLMYRYNETQQCMVGEWNIMAIPFVMSEDSTFHTCVFNGTHYTFNATYNVQTWPIYGDVTQINFATTNGEVFVCFHFGRNKL